MAAVAGSLRRALLIVNPTATTTRPGLRELITTALAGTVDLEVASTRARGHATELAAHAHTRGVSTLIVLGGDGTANEVVQAIAGTDVALGLVPGGGANVLVRALGLPTDPVAATAHLLRVLRIGRRRRIGLGRAELDDGTQRLFTCNAGLGFDAAVVAQVEGHPARKQLLRQLSYVAAAAGAWRVARAGGGGVRIVLDDGTTSGPRPIALVANAAPYTALGRHPLIAHPDASFDRGLDLLTLTDASLTRLLLVLVGSLGGGRHVRLPGVQHLSDLDHLALLAEGPLPVQVDGDAAGRSQKLELTAVPNALDVLA
jgi:diacylglycerol kinase family enzyme